jgi:hypothetical protein
LLGIAEQCKHQSVAVDNAGRGREQGRGAMQRRLQCLRLRGREKAQILDTAGRGVGANGGQHRFLRRIGRDNQFA